MHTDRQTNERGHAGKKDTPPPLAEVNYVKSVGAVIPFVGLVV